MLYPVFVVSSCLTSDLKRTKLHPTPKDLVADAFVAKWKKDDEPNDFGRKLFKPDNVHRVELIQIILDNMACLYIVHPSMLKEEWVKAELDDVMKMLMESGETNNVLISNFSVD